MAELHFTQLAAVADCCDRDKRLVAVTGQAGTGKTTIIKTVCDELVSQQILFCIAAPTGKAARRIKEATGYDAMTIHKMLAYSKPELDEETGKAVMDTAPGYHRDRPMPYAVVIVDEYAMVSWTLHRNVVDALRAGACFRVFGDISQLPPIDTAYPAGELRTPFEACLDKPNSHTLTEVFRQSGDSDVLVAATAIRKGQYPTPGKQYTQRLTEQPIEKLLDHINESEIDYSSIDNQIISPGKKSWVGTIALNQLLRNHYNSDPDNVIDLPRHKWDKPLRIGVKDKVVCTENTYDMRDYQDRYEKLNEAGEGYAEYFIDTPDNKQMLNGEVGIVVDIRLDGSFEIDFGDRVVEIPAGYHEIYQGKAFHRDPRRSIDLAYALTTHKTQGSEFVNVCYIMNKSTWYNQNRNNLYTGVTRARRLAHVISDQRSLRISLGTLPSRGPQQFGGKKDG